MAKFPGGTHTFTVRRDVGLIQDPTNPQNQIDGGKSNVLTGVSVQVKPLIGFQVAGDAGVMNEGRFHALTFSGTAIHNNDDLQDEVAVDNAGRPVLYTVSEIFDNGYYLQMFIHHKAIGG